MKDNPFSTLTLEELKAKKKQMSGIAMGLGTVMLITCAALIYLAIKGGNTALIAVAIGCGMTLMPSFVSISQIDAAIKAREQGK